jgi:hypothetical protein
LFLLNVSLLHAQLTEKDHPVSDADADVSQFRLHDLETKLQTMPKGPERDYFSGVLANRQDTFRIPSAC